MLVAIHVAAAGLWLGCILVEVAFERVLSGARDLRPVLAGLHRRVDILIETPAFAATAATGAMLFPAAEKGPALYAMIALGAIAVIVNVWCVFIVVARDGAATRGDGEEYQRLDKLQHKVGAVVLLAVIAAMIAGVLHTAP